jgi:hypothetical protein
LLGCPAGIIEDPAVNCQPFSLQFIDEFGSKLLVCRFTMSVARRLADGSPGAAGRCGFAALHCMTSFDLWGAAQRQHNLAGPFRVEKNGLIEHTRPAQPCSPCWRLMG